MLYEVITEEVLADVAHGATAELDGGDGAGELFVPVANPAPTFDPEIRKGDNLFRNNFV